MCWRNNQADVRRHGPGRCALTSECTLHVHRHNIRVALCARARQGFGRQEQLGVLLIHTRGLDVFVGIHILEVNVFLAPGMRHDCTPRSQEAAATHDRAFSQCEGEVYKHSDSEDDEGAEEAPSVTADRHDLRPEDGDATLVRLVQGVPTHVRRNLLPRQVIHQRRPVVGSCARVQRLHHDNGRGDHPERHAGYAEQAQKKERHGPEHDDSQLGSVALPPHFVEQCFRVWREPGREHILKEGHHENTSWRDAVFHLQEQIHELEGKARTQCIQNVAHDYNIGPQDVRDRLAFELTLLRAAAVLVRGICRGNVRKQGLSETLGAAVCLYLSRRVAQDQLGEDVQRPEPLRSTVEARIRGTNQLTHGTVDGQRILRVLRLREEQVHRREVDPDRRP
mmetsp:Transcript_26990/g.89568  ORF Transcript_26990/g.89568 Transcript_26990/m.89568 type:complete len:394 (+) Transcript_26990:366-1547(+)